MDVFVCKDAEWTHECNAPNKTRKDFLFSRCLQFTTAPPTATCVMLIFKGSVLVSDQFIVFIEKFSKLKSTFLKSFFKKHLVYAFSCTYSDDMSWINLKRKYSAHAIEKISLVSHFVIWYIYHACGLILPQICFNKPTLALVNDSLET